MTKVEVAAGMPAGSASPPGTAPCTATDRFTDALKADDGVIERLSALDPRLQPLMTPPPGTAAETATIADIAAAIGVPVGSILAAINAGAAAPRCADRPSEPDQGPKEPVPAWISRAESLRASHVDVRPILAARGEPFAAVMHAAAAVAPGEILIIDAPFNPTPLRQALAAKGFATYGTCLAAGHWQVWCHRTDGSEPNVTAPQPPPPAERTWWEGEAVHIDVRGLEAPVPLIRILALIEGDGHRGRIIVHHHRDPLYLYPELDDRGWRYDRLPGPEGEVCLELRQGR